MRLGVLCTLKVVITCKLRYNQGMKFCTRCLKNLPVEQFSKRLASPDGLSNYCKSCVAKYYSTYSRSEKSKAVVREQHLIRNYGITQKQYDAMLERQGGSCAMCDRPQSELMRNLAVDHDHSCCSGKKSCGKCVRGLLCPACNTFLRKVESGKVSMERLNAYVSKFAH
jgi:hypothetical protein